MRNKLTGVALFAAGAGIGIGVGLMCAPRAGKHTRTRILNSANRARHRVEEVRDEVRVHMGEWLDEASEALASNIAAGKEKASEGGERVKELMHNVRERLDQGKERVEAYVRSVAS